MGGGAGCKTVLLTASMVEWAMLIMMAFVAVMVVMVMV